MKQTHAEIIAEGRKLMAEAREIRARGEERRRLAASERGDSWGQETAPEITMTDPSDANPLVTSVLSKDGQSAEVVGAEVPNDNRMIDQPADAGSS